MSEQKTVNLTFCCLGCPLDGKYPQEVMKDLGITYFHATPQSMFDSWQFWNCRNVPTILPDWIRVSNIDPMKSIGFGLSKISAELIKKDENK